MDNKPLSDAWRVNRSQVPVVELAQAVRALAKLAGSVCPEVKAIKFNTADGSRVEGDKKNNTMVIDPTFAVNAGYPIPPDAFDVLAGLAVHEAGHLAVGSPSINEGHITAQIAPGISGKRITLNSGRIKDIRFKAPTSMNLCNRPFTMGMMLAVGEEVYTDRWLGRHHPIQAKYVIRSRRAYNTADENIDWTDPFQAWKAISVYGHMPSDNMPEDTLKALAIMTRLSKDLAMTDSGLNDRILAYYVAWKSLFQLSQEQAAEELTKPKQDAVDVSSKPTFVKKDIDVPGNTTGDDEDKEDEQPTDNGDGDTPSDEPPPDGADAQGTSGDADVDGDEDGEDTDGDGGAGDNDGDGGAGSGSSPQPPTASLVSKDNSLPIAPIATIPVDLAASIAEALDMESTDITDQLIQLLEDVPLGKDELRPPTVWQRAMTEVDTTFDEALYRDLLWIKELKNTIGVQTWHGEKRGRIDQPRLYRAAIDGGAFKVRKKTPLKEINLVLLLDSSTSMANRRSVYECAKSLHKVIPESTVLTYQNVNHGVLISVQCEKKGPFRQIRPQGTTPSGLAILAAAMKFPDSMIIHFTDGETNVGPLPHTVLELMEEKFPKVQVVNIIYQRDVSDASYSGSKGHNYINLPIADISEFPEKLKVALRPWYMGGYQWNSMR